MPAKKKVVKKTVKKSTKASVAKVTKKVKEEIKVEGKQVVSRVKALIKEGNVRKITVKDNKGKVILSLPVTAGIIGAIILPPLIILGALAAFITECTITVQREK